DAGRGARRSARSSVARRTDRLLRGASRATARAAAARGFHPAGPDAGHEPGCLGPSRGPPRCGARARRPRGVKPADRREFFRRLKAANPAPRSELEYSTPFELLVAVILSAQ